MAKKYYNIQIREDRQFWHSPGNIKYVSREFTRGYIFCSKSYYPSPDIRILDAETNKVIEEIKGNSKVKIRR